MQIQHSGILCTQRRLKNSQHTLHTHHDECYRQCPRSSLHVSGWMFVVDSGVPPCRSSCPDPWIPGVSQPGSGRWPPPSGGLPPLLGSVWPPPSGRGFPVLPAGQSTQLTCSLRTQGTAREGARAASRRTAPKLTLRRPLPASDLPVGLRKVWPLAPARVLRGPRRLQADHTRRTQMGTGRSRHGRTGLDEAEQENTEKREANSSPSQLDCPGRPGSLAPA